MENYTSLHALQRALRQGDLSCEAIVQYYLSQIEQHSNLNAFVEVWADEALEHAASLNDKIAAGKEVGRLAGMVIGIKDNLCYKDHKVSAASKALENFTSIYSATAIERLTKEDAIIIGRLNCDEFGMGSTNENSVYDSVRNPHDTDKVAGGSSGGCAAAVAANMCWAAIGSDTGGSVRQPAAFCGVVGLKPTYGRISRHGLIAYASSFDQIGVLTKSVEDAALLLAIMAGADDFDSTAALSELPAHGSLKSGGHKTYKVAYLSEALEHKGLDTEVQSKMMGLLDQLKDEKHEVNATSFEEMEYVVPAYYILTAAEASSNLNRYDGMHFGFQAEGKLNLVDFYTENRTQSLGWEVKRRIMLGAFVLSSGYYDAYYSKTQRARRKIIERLDAILDEHDFILLPTAPTTAFGLGELKEQDPTAMFLADIYTVMANLGGYPAVSLPLFTNSNGMPIGVQLISQRFTEEKLFSFSKELMQRIKA